MKMYLNHRANKATQQENISLSRYDRETINTGKGEREGMARRGTCHTFA